MKIAFLDRDGVINKFPGHGGYVTKVKDFHFLPGTLEGILKLTDLGYTIFVISNQAGISRGVYSNDKLKRITKFMIKGVAKFGGRIKKVFYCTHTSAENCDCRKPKTGSIEKALQLLKKNRRDITRSYFIGDAESDIEAGRKVGCTTIFVLSGKDSRKELRRWKIKPDYVAKNLLEATKIVEKESSCCSCLRGGRA